MGLQMKLTDALIMGFKSPAEGRDEYPDELVTGLRLRVGQSSKTWVLRARVGAKVITTTLGRYPALSLAKAREAARLVLTDYAETGSPRTKLTIEALAAEFVERHCKVKNKRWQEQERQLALYVLSEWRGRDVATVRKRDVVALLDSLSDRGLTTMVNRVLSLLHKMFRWAQGRDMIDTNPAASIPKPAAETARDRVLDVAEIKALWGVTGHMGYPFGTLCRLLLLTGQRLREVSGMQWADIDLPAGKWVLAAQDTKAARKHLVPLSAPAIAILESLPQLGPHVLTSMGTTPVSGWSKAKATADRLMAASFDKPVAHWTFHDLRRTFATHAARIGVSRFNISRVLNHADTGVTGRHYDHHEYEAEKRHALDAWGAELMRIVGEAPTETNVTPIRRA
jgi:integrase